MGGPDHESGATLAVRDGGRWIGWWQEGHAPASWTTADSRVTAAVAWREAGRGVQQGELSLAGSGLAWRVRVILARFDPAMLDVSLQYAPDPFGRPDRWQVDDAPADAALALNAGQFTGKGPWGWLVQEGVELRPPGHGPLAAAVIQDTAGMLRFVPAWAIDSVRAAGGIRFAIQSYPAILIDNGVVPEPLRHEGLGVNLNHRDARVALCELRDGRWLAMLTRFEGLNGALEMLPLGPTTPEMSAIAGALGCARAVLLDGGMSGQLMVRGGDGTPQQWDGLRKVPAGLVLLPRR